MRLRNTGVILDTNGALDPTQIWPQAGQYGTQLLNVQLTPTRKAGEFSVFFPQAYLSQIGVTNPQAFPKGAYLAFPTVKEALTHARLRTIGVVVDDKGRLNSMQPWAQAVNAVVNNPEILPAHSVAGWSQPTGCGRPRQPAAPRQPDGGQRVDRAGHADEDGRRHHRVRRDDSCA